MRVRRLEVPAGGPEDLRFDGFGRLLTGLADGRVVAIAPDTGAVDTVADTGGRPLGLHVGAGGELLVCDACRGLLRIEGGATTVLADATFGMASNVDVAADGTIWFTTSTTRWPLADYTRDLVEDTRTGAVFRLPPGGVVELVRDGLAYANGVVVDPAGSAVWVAETGGYRVHRLARDGGDDVVVELPGFPDNMSIGSDGLLWIAIAAPRNAALDRVRRFPARLRRVVARLPRRLLEGPRRPMAAVAVDPATAVLTRAVRLRRRDRLTMCTSVLERDGTLYLGSVHGRAVARLDPAAGVSRERWSGRSR